MSDAPEKSAQASAARRLWLWFCQCVTAGAAALLVYELALHEPAESPAAAPCSNESAAGQSPTDAPLLGDFSSAVERAAPAVVTVFERSAVPGERAEEIGSDWNNYPELHMRALGSGVIVAASGGVITNYHVVEGLHNLFVGLADGRIIEAELLGSDPETDLALLKINAKDLPVIELGDSDSLKVGQTVLAIGNPFEVGQTVTAGIVSALGRHGLGLNCYEDFIQTDAAINQGNSGGALIDLSGRLVGINAAIFSLDVNEGFVGIGFAIPSTIVKEVLPAMMQGRIIERGYFGFVPRQFAQELAQDLGLAVPQGVLVQEVVPGSPAANAGLQPFDVLLSINGKPVKRANRALSQIARIKPGSVAAVEVLRGRTQISLKIQASMRPRNAKEREALAPEPEE